MINKRNVVIIGAGQIGSRHLQALKKVSVPLNIVVIDPSSKSLEIAKARYNEIIAISNIHSVDYYNDLPLDYNKIDLAIVATSSDYREVVVKKLLKSKRVKYLILEKLLFNKRKDYEKVEKLLAEYKCKAWVNCSMRTIPFYFNLKSKLRNGPIQYYVTGSNFGLATTAIHYIDQIAFFKDCYSFTIDTDNLENIIDSKRQGFLELTGSLRVIFKDGSYGYFTSYTKGNAPIIVNIYNESFRCITKELDNKAWISEMESDWKWKEVEAKILFQSEMTTKLVEEILNTGKCVLPTYEQSVALHIPLLEGLLKYVNSHNHTKSKLNYYPFT